MPEPITVPARRFGIVVFLLIGLALDGVAIAFHAKMPVAPLILFSLLAAMFTFAPLYQLLNPKPFAVLRDSGVAFPLLNIGEIPWARIVDAQVGPRSLTRARETTVFFQPALVLKLASDAVPAPGAFNRFPTATSTDGTVEELIDMSYSSMRTPEFIAMLGRWRPVAAARHLAEPTNAFTPTPVARKQNRRAAGFLVLFGIIFGSVGGCVGVQTIRARTWPTTSGVVLSSTMTSSSDRNGTTYSPVIVYRYSVDGHEYTGRRFAISHSSSASAVQAILARYPVGGTATVFYNPADPASAVLEQSAFWLPAVFLAFGALACAVAVLLWRSGGTNPP